MERHITVPVAKEEIQDLRAGDYVYLTGVIYTARDAAHKRMDEVLSEGKELGLGGMIGKGKRSQAVQDAIVRNKAVYFAAVGGAGALLSKCIKRADVIAYDDLGTEAIRRLEIEDLPAIVVIDSEGNNLYETAVKEYAEE